MASAQQQAPAAAPVQSNKDKAVSLEQLIKEAENIVVKEKSCTRGAILNETRCDLHLDDKHSWSGYFPPVDEKLKLHIIFDTNPPEEIKKCKIGMFLHNAAPPEGSKAGVAYASPDGQWVLAWHVPPHCPGKSIENTVYIEYRKCRGPVNWNEIEENLDKYGKPMYECAHGSACISPGPIANLGAAFYTGLLN